MLLFEQDEVMTQPAQCWLTASDTEPTPDDGDDDDEQADPGGDSDPQPAD